MTDEATLRAVGPNGKLRGNEAENIVIWIEGTTSWGLSRLSTQEGAINRGTLRLETTSNDGFDRGVYLTISEGTLTNAATGVIDVRTGAGDGRTITGNLVNQGSIAIETGTRLDLNGTGHEFVHAAGQVAADGTLRLNNGRFRHTGGSIAGTIQLINSELFLGTTPAQPQAFDLYGPSNVLRTDVPEDTTLNLYGTTSFGLLNLVVPQNVTNFGTIRMEAMSSDGFDRGVYLTISEGTLTNAATGVIDVRTGAGDGRTITGNLVNQGSIQNFGSSLQVNGTLTNRFGALIGGSGSLHATTLNNHGVFDLTPPSVLNIKVDPTVITVSYFDIGGMNVESITKKANYRLFASGGDGIFNNGNDIDLSGAIEELIHYDPETRVAKLTLSSPLAEEQYLVSIEGDSVVNGSGVPLLAGLQVQAVRPIEILRTAVTLELQVASDTGVSNTDRLTPLVRGTANWECYASCGSSCVQAISCLPTATCVPGTKSSC